MRKSAAGSPMPEGTPSATALDCLPANDTARGLWLAHSSPLELCLIQFARHERPRRELRDRILQACGLP